MNFLLTWSVWKLTKNLYFDISGILDEKLPWHLLYLFKHYSFLPKPKTLKINSPLERLEYSYIFCIDYNVKSKLAVDSLFQKKLITISLSISCERNVNMLSTLSYSFHVHLPSSLYWLVFSVSKKIKRQ